MPVKYWDKAWSLVEGCTPISEACEHCWLGKMKHRFGHVDIDAATGSAFDMTDNNGQFSGVVIPRPDRLEIPLKIKKPTVFAIWSDLFHEKVSGQFIRDAFEIMSTPHCLRHTFLILTKRPERLKILFSEETNFYIGGGDYIPNVWLGTTVENQLQVDTRIPHLLAGAGEFKKFLSVEPLLGTVNLALNLPFPEHGRGGIVPGKHTLDAVICGGESGFGARPMHPDWVRSLRYQCQAAGVPFTFKQWGEWAPIPGLITKPGDFCVGQDGSIEKIEKDYVCCGNESDGAFMCRTKKAGHLLDGKEYINLPWRKV